MFRQRVIEKLAEQSDIPDKSNLLPVMATLAGGSLLGAGLGSLTVPAAMRLAGSKMSFDEIKKMRGKILAGGAGAGLLGGAAVTGGMLKAKEKEEIKKRFFDKQFSEKLTRDPVQSVKEYKKLLYEIKYDFSKFEEHPKIKKQKTN